MAKRRNYSSEFKSKVALAAIRGDGTIAELSSQFKVHPNMITQWKRKALSGVKAGFDHGNAKHQMGHEGGGKATAGQDWGACGGAGFFIASLQSLSVNRRRDMIEPNHRQLSLARQCTLVEISRSTFYYQPRGENPLNLRLMRSKHIAVIQFIKSRKKPMMRAFEISIKKAPTKGMTRKAIGDAPNFCVIASILAMAVGVAPKPRPA